MTTRQDYLGTGLLDRVWDLTERLDAKKIGLDKLGRSPSDIAYSQQIHTDNVLQVTNPGLQGEGDALITDVPGLILQIGVADCTPIVITGVRADGATAIAAIHSGRGPTSRNIVAQTIGMMRKSYDIESLSAWIGPSAGPDAYEFGPEAYDLFDQRHIKTLDSKIYLHVAGQVYDQLTNAGISQDNILWDHSCTITDAETFFSYRRDGLTGQNMYVRARISPSNS